MPDDRITQIERKIDPAISGAIALAGEPGGGALTIAPRNMGEMMEFAKMMSLAGVVLPEHCRGQPGVCLAIAMQAFKWGADPFAVAGKSYVVNNRVAYESQLIHAIVISSNVLSRRLRAIYSGDGAHRRCKILGDIRGEDEVFEYESPRLGEIPVKNSPLWKADPDQQLFYYSTRAWARRWVPEVILGIVTPDEAMGAIIDHVAPEAIPDPPKLEDFETENDPVESYLAMAENADKVPQPGRPKHRRATKAEMEVRRRLAMEIPSGQVAVDPESKPSEVLDETEDEAGSSSEANTQPRGPAADRSSAQIDEQTRAGAVEAGGSPAPRREVRDLTEDEAQNYAVLPVPNGRDRRPDYRAWWIALFLPKLRQSKDAQEYTYRIADNADIIAAYKATLSPAGEVNAQRELEDIAATLKG